MIRFDVRRGLYALGIVFLIPLFWVNESSLGVGENRSTKFTLGLPFSPWFHYEKSFVKQEWGEGATKSFTTSINWSYGVELLSWSSLCLVLALACFIFARFVKSLQSNAISRHAPELPSPP